MSIYGPLPIDTIPQPYELINPERPLKEGWIIELEFQWTDITGWTYERAAQWATIESQLAKKCPEFEVISYRNTPNLLVVRCEVKREEISSPDFYQAGFWGAVTAKALFGYIVGTVFFAFALTMGGVYFIGATKQKTAEVVAESAKRTAEAVKDMTETDAGKVLVSGAGALGWAALIGVVYLVARAFGVVK